MKKLIVLGLLLLPMMAWSQPSPPPFLSLQVTTNLDLRSPNFTNFFRQNSNRLNAAVSPKTVVVNGDTFTLTITTNTTGNIRTYTLTGVSATNQIGFVPVGTNSVVVAGANVTVVTNQVGNIISYTISGNAGGGNPTTNAADLTTGILSLARLSNINTQQIDLATIALFTNLPASTSTGGGNITNNGVALTNQQPVFSVGGTNIASTNAPDFLKLVGAQKAGQTPASEVGNILTDWVTDQASFLQHTSPTGLDTNKFVGAGVGFLGDKMAVYYAAYDAGWTGRVFAVFGNSLNGFSPAVPVLTPGAHPAWDSGHISGARLFQENGTNYLYYFAGTNGAAGAGGTNSGTFEPPPEDIGVAYSTDGTNFTKYSGNPIIVRGGAGAADQNVCYQLCVIKEGSVYYGFYNGQDVADNSERVMMVTAPSPLGPWTKYAGNPVFTGIPGVGARNLAGDPFVFRLRNGGWGILVYNQEGALSNNEIVSGYSWDLTNWFGARYVTNNGARISGYGATFFDDGGPCILTAQSAQTSAQTFRPVPPKNDVARWRSNSFSGDNNFSGSNFFSSHLALSGPQYRPGFSVSANKVKWGNPQSFVTKSADWSGATPDAAGAWQWTLQVITNTATTNITYTPGFNFFSINSNSVQTTVIIPATNTVWIDWRTDAATNISGRVHYKDSVASGGGSSTFGGQFVSSAGGTNLNTYLQFTNTGFVLSNTASGNSSWWTNAGFVVSNSSSYAMLSNASVAAGMYVPPGNGGSVWATNAITQTNGANNWVQLSNGNVTATGIYTGNGSGLTNITATATNISPLFGTNVGTTAFFTAVNDAQVSTVTDTINWSFEGPGGSGTTAALSFSGKSDNSGYTNVTVTIPNASVATNVASFNILTNDFVIGTRYTNGPSSGFGLARRAFISASFSLADTTANSQVTLVVEQGGGITNKVTVANSATGSTMKQQVSSFVSPGAFFHFDDEDTVGGAVTIISGTSSWTGF